MTLRRFVGSLLSLALLSSPAHAQLLHYWDFGTSANDVFAGAIGTLNGGATVSGGVLNLDGVDDYVSFGSHLVPTSGDYSVTLWARTTGTQAGIIEFISQGFSGAGFYIGGNGGTGIRSSDAWGLVPGAVFGQDGAIHSYALTVSAVNAFFYVDGALVATHGSTITTTSAGTDTRFGRQFTPFGEFFNGQLDEVRIYDNTLSAEEVRTLAFGATPTAAPEPTSLVLLATGICGVGFVSRRRRRNVVDLFQECHRRKA